MSSRPLGAGRAAASRLARRLFARAPGGVGATLGLYAHLWRHGDLPRVVSEAPAAARAVVLAPHPDDETIGCGGLVRKLTLAGTVVSVVFLSDGRRGAAAARSWRSDRGTEERLVERRKGEAAAAAEVLGVEGLIFLDLRDGEVYADAAAVGRLRDELARLRPDIVLLPFLTDQHPRPPRDQRSLPRGRGSALWRWPGASLLGLRDPDAPVRERRRRHQRRRRD